MTQKLKIEKSDCNTIEPLKGNDFVTKNKTVLKSPKKNQELAMKDIEITALKLEVLTQTEIAKNNKDAYDKVCSLYDEKRHELLKLKGEHATQYDELSAVEGKLIKAQSEVTKLNKDLDNALSSFVESEGKKNKFIDFSGHLSRELSIATKDLESKSETVTELNAELKSIPNWIKWIFKNVF
jgi:septal ring factor EnvC (AmiA/AmiB activator)